MPRALTDNGRVELRLRSKDMAMLSCVAALKRVDLASFFAPLLCRRPPCAERASVGEGWKYPTDF